MKKTTIIVLAIIILIAIVIGIMYVIDTTRMLKNKAVIFSTWGYTVNAPEEIKNGSKDIPKEDKIIFNDNGGRMACIEYDCKPKEFNSNQEIIFTSIVYSPKKHYTCSYKIHLRHFILHATNNNTT